MSYKQEPKDIVENYDEFKSDALRLVVLTRSMMRKTLEILETIERNDPAVYTAYLGQLMAFEAEIAIETVALLSRMLHAYTISAKKKGNWWGALEDIDLEIRDLAGHVIKMKVSHERENWGKVQDSAEIIYTNLTRVFALFSDIRDNKRPIHTLANTRNPRALRNQSELEQVAKEFINEDWNF